MPLGGVVRLVRHRLRRAAEVAVGRAGYDLVKRGGRSPIPDPVAIPEETWQPSELIGVDLRLDAAWALLEDELAPLITEFPADFDFGNSSYGSVDAETLYALLRWTRPRLVIELGSGTSSHVIHAAGGFEHRIFDPNPWAATRLGPVAGLAITPLRSEDIPIEHFADLRAGDVLFLDTTHIVKTGGDVHPNPARSPPAPRERRARACPRHLPALRLSAAVGRWGKAGVRRAVSAARLPGVQPRLRCAAADERDGPLGP